MSRNTMHSEVQNAISALLHSMQASTSSGTRANIRTIARDMLADIDVSDDAMRAELQHLIELLSVDGAPHESAVEDALEQLEYAVADTERAADTILSNAEDIQKQLDSNTPDIDAIKEHFVGLIEACTFQDIVGQRIRKVQTFLRGLNTNDDDALKPSQTYEESLLSGPAKDDKPSQDDIDRLFNS